MANSMDRLIYAGEMRIFPEPEPAATDVAVVPQPIYLLADSQLLFWRDGGLPFLDRVRLAIPGSSPRAAYLGASNGDHPDFYAIFTAAMEGVGITRCRMIPTGPTAEDLAWLGRADVVLLAGGDVGRGWDAFSASGLREAVVRRHREGAVVMGISAGAVQLGLLGWPQGKPAAELLFGTFGLVPFVVDAHAEESDWEELRRVVGLRGGALRGLGIPRGGGIVVHPDGTVEAVRHPAYEILPTADGVACNLIVPVDPGPPRG